MPTVRQSIPTLIQGVSTQVAHQRQPSQVTSADNVILKIQQGMEKRAGSEYIASDDTEDGTLDLTSPSSQFKIHWIDRDANNRFAVMIASYPDEPIQVFDLEGTKYTVNYGTGVKNDVPGSLMSECVTVADATFILSRANTPTATSGVLDKTKMPLRMDFDGTDFEVNYVDWVARSEGSNAGDDTTDPGPRFVRDGGVPIADICFFRDRLIVGADEYIDMSQAGDYFNFYVDDYTNLTDADPISGSITTNEVNRIRYLVPFNQALGVFTEGASQFEIRNQGALTPTSFNIVPTTAYRINADVRPAKMNNQLYFLAKATSYTSVFEYIYQDEVASNLAVEITNHVSGYIDENIREIVTANNHEMLFLLSEDNPNIIFVYTGYWSGTDKLQSAWCRWVFDESYEILSGKVYDNYLYLIIRQGSKVFMERVYVSTPKIPDGMKYSPRLDRRITLTGVYDSAERRTVFTLPFVDETINAIVLGPDWNTAGKWIEGENVGGTELHVQGNYSAEACYVGRTFGMDVELSRQYVRDEQGTVIQGTLQILSMTVYHRDASRYDIVVTPKGRPEKVYRFNPFKVGGLQAILGSFIVEDEGQYTIKPMASADSTFAIRNDTALPCTITNIEMVCRFVPYRNNIAK